MERKGFAFLLAVALLCGSGAMPSDGREFAGIYNFSEAKDLGPEVRTKFSVQLFNYSSSAVKRATVTLRDRVRPTRTYATFRVAEIPVKQSIQLTELITVPSEQCGSWDRFGPLLLIEFADSSGLKVTRTVELARGVTATEGGNQQ